MSMDILLGDDHPLALELVSLREAVNYHQAEAHRATLQLQHHSLEHAAILQHLRTLENENSYLRDELQVHRFRAPNDGSHRDSLQVQELTLALRRLSDKLDLTEKVLFQRNEELASAQSAQEATRKAGQNAFESVERLRAKLEASHARERELMSRVKASEEQRKMSDLVVEEYANLVRSIEGRSSLNTRSNGKDVGSTPRNSLDGLMQARQGLHKLLQDSNSDSEKLHTEISRLHSDLDSVRSELEVERATAQEDRRRLADAQLELHRLKCDDNAAAKMVSRYMKFSQSSTDILHAAIDNLKARQQAIITSYEARLQQSEDRIASEMRQSEMLRRALDDLAEDIPRQSYGRRREIALRLALIDREEIISERLRRWLLRSQEIVQKAESVQEIQDFRAAFEGILSGAREILSNIDNISDPASETTSSAARIYVAQAAVKVLQVELERETDRRLYFEYQLATSRSHQSERRDLTSTSLVASLSQSSTPAISVTSELPISDAPVATLAADVPDDDLSASRPTADACLEPIEPVLVKTPSDSKKDFLQEEGRNLVSSISCSTEADGTRVTPIGQDDGHASHHVNVLNGNEEVISAMVDVTISTAHEVPPPGRVEETLVETPGYSTSELSTSPSDIMGSVTSMEDARSSQMNSIRQPADETVPLGNSESPQILSDDTSKDDFDSLESQRSEKYTMQALDSIPPESNPVSQLFSIPQDERYKEPLHSSPRPDNEAALADPASAGESSKQESLTFAPMLTKLAKVGERYVALQSSFRDCHVSLQELRQTCNDSSSSNFLHVAIERLSDYCEDARVELEIRVADEERIAKGFQTLFSVPGALSEVNEQEMLPQIEGFLDGSDPAVRRAQDILQHKLDDLQHDIASVKRAMHSSASPVLSSQDLHPGHEDHPKASGWTSWTGSILAPSRSSSPAPTFGTVMTSPRLRHSSSTRSLHGEPSNTQKTLANLNLRIPMPALSQSQGADVASHPAPLMQRGGPRARVTSNVFGVGLRGGLVQGMRSSSLALRPGPSSKPRSGNDIGELDSDVE